MNSIEKLFAFGYATDTVTLKGVNITLTVLDSRRIADALNATTEQEPTAQALVYRQQVLARAITSINGEQQFVDINKPTPEEVAHMLKIVEQMHYSAITVLYQHYEKLDNAINEDIEDQVKK